MLLSEEAINFFSKTLIINKLVDGCTGENKTNSGGKPNVCCNSCYPKPADAGGVKRRGETPRHGGVLVNRNTFCNNFIYLLFS